MGQWIDQIAKHFDAGHGVLMVALACLYTWRWARGGFRCPWWVHVIALIAVLAGVLITLSLPPPTNPDPLVQFLFPIVFPGIALFAAYAIPVVMGFLHILDRSEAPAACDASVAGKPRMDVHRVKTAGEPSEPRLT
jgi:hypothetical protein